MAQPLRVRLAIVATFVAACTACGGDRELLQAHKKLVSLQSTTASVAEAWLSGAASGTYASTALEQTFLLVEHARQAVATPQMLVDPRASHMVESAGRLSRLLAAMNHDIKARDAAALRQHLSQFPVVGPRP